MIDNFNQPDFCKDRPRQTMSYQPQSPEQIEASFHRTLSLRNPIYNLLLSPFESLSKAEMH